MAASCAYQQRDSLLISASVDVHMSITNTGGSKHHTMWVESGAGDGCGASAGEERRPGLEGVEEGAVDVENSELVVVGSPIVPSKSAPQHASQVLDKRPRKGWIRT